MKQLAVRLAKIKQELNGFPQWADVKLGLEARKMIWERVGMKGIASDDTSFSPYSTKPMLVGAKSFRTKGQATNYFGTRGLKNKKSKELRWVTHNGYHLAVLEGGYKKLRQLESSQVGYKSFLWTGGMWQSIKPVATKKISDGHYLTEIASNSPHYVKVLQGHFDREKKEIMGLTKSEENTLNIRLDKYVTEIVNRAING